MVRRPTQASNYRGRSTEKTRAGAPVSTREDERYSQEAVQAGFLEEATQEGARELVQQRKLTSQGKFSCTANNPIVSIKHLL